MWVGQVDLGSVSDWASLALALATAVASGVAYVLRGRNRRLEEEANRLRAELEQRNLILEEQQRVVDLELSRAAAFDQLSDQARLITVSHKEDAKQGSAYVVNNGSDQSIFDVEARLYQGPEDVFTNWLPTLGGGKSHATSAPGDPFSCDLRFRDFRGRFWRLDGHGTLTPLEGYMPRVRAVPPGYFED